MSPPHLLLLLLALLLSPPLLLASSSFPLPTIAIAAVSNSSSNPSKQHLACGLVPAAGGAAAGYRISCASVSNRSAAAPHVYAYGGDGTCSPYSAVVAGDGYLCSAAPTSSPPMSMRWWDLNEAGDGSKRVYRGRVLSAVSGGGESVCGLVGERMQCWRCPWGEGAPARVGFSAVAVGGGFVCGLVVGSGERRLSALLSKGPNTTVEQFPLVALRAATDCFSPAKRIGSGSFGAVYRASLPDGREVAIKRAERRDTGGPSSSSAAAARRVDHEAAFVSELALLSRVNHKNLVRLLGFCADGGERILVYEFMPNGTLHDHLHRRAASAAAPLSPPLASWPSRLRLALGAARGIEYMHTYAVPPIIHRDIKSSNILLDSCWTAKVSDFGLSLLNTLDGDNAAAGDGGNAGDGDDEERCVTAGTVGYMDPEYYRLQHLTDKSDVYSFGVVLLELLSGCKAIQKYEGSGSPKNVVDMAVPHIEGDQVHRVLDARLPLPTPWEMEAVAYVGYLAADCVRLAGRDRPTMSEVVGVLERAVAACDEYEEGGAGAGAGGEPALSRSCTDGSTAT
ncbi:hypothetical protein OsI_16004 [Oryza sativa Indica Group]|uniref:Protein kinase domain-containing protein n=1 Tax=Oryza sativa subsp. indica TaxID=39946 RepID=A2XTS1_ORYSI|nr:hypothetical protein OsI_16004 [Oryza sativa Indica Group]